MAAWPLARRTAVAAALAAAGLHSRLGGGGSCCRGSAAVLYCCKSCGAAVARPAIRARGCCIIGGAACLACACVYAHGCAVYNGCGSRREQISRLAAVAAARLEATARHGGCMLLLLRNKTACSIKALVAF